MNVHRKSQRAHPTAGMTVIELVIVIGIIGLLIALLLPATRMSRESARRMSCSNNFKQIGLALHNYHSAHKFLPAAMSGTGIGPKPTQGNANRLSGLVALLPFLEQQALWDQISTPTEVDSVSYPSMGPVPWDEQYPPWRADVHTLRCPSNVGEESALGQTNYTFSIGDMARSIHQPSQFRGAFACRIQTRFKDITDGLGQTMAMAEIGSATGRSVVGQYAVNQPIRLLENPIECRETLDSSRPGMYADGVSLGSVGRGGRWADGAAGFSLVNTILPPNSPSCAVAGAVAVDGIYSAGSYHPGGAHVLMADGSVIFITEEIDAGQSSDPTLTPEQMEAEAIASPYGIWGALGTATGQEQVELE